MTIHFDRPVGATADTSELEYISALMQTEKLFLRQEGSLTAKDIHFYLKSRHGLRIPCDQIEKEIIAELGGTPLLDGGEKEAASEQQNGAPNGRTSAAISLGVGDVHSIVIEEGNEEADDNDVEVAAPRMSTPVLLKQQEHVQLNTLSHRTYQRPSMFHASAISTISSRPSLQRTGTTYQSKRRMAMRNRAMRFSQAVNQEDVEKYLHYEELKQNEANGGDDVIPSIAYDGEVKLDLAQIAGLLLIPQLRQLRVDSDESQKLEEDRDFAEEDVVLDDIIDLVLAILIREIPGLSHGLEITPDVLSLILASEPQNEWPQQTQTAMMKAVRAASEDGIPRLNRQTLLRVLTEDILAYNVNYEMCTKETAVKEVNDVAEVYAIATKKKTSNKEEQQKLKRIWTASNIDCNADTYRSNTWNILAWYAIVVTLVAYLFKGPLPNHYWETPDCEGQFACAIVNATVRWLELLIMLTVVGFPFYYLSNMGNSMYRSKRVVGLICVAIVTTALYVLVPWFYRADFGLFHSGLSEEEVENGEEETNNRAYLGPISLALGFLLILVQILQLCPHILMKQGSVSYSQRSALEFKRAAIGKVNRMVQNAVNCHLREQGDDNITVTTSNLRTLDNTMVKFHQTFMETEQSGGIRWTWRKVRDRSLFYEEGIWLWPRLVASNIAQWLTVFGWIGFFAWCLNRLNEEEPVIDEMSNEQLVTVMSVGFPAGLLAAISLSLVYVPSAMSSVIKYRSGVFGSLHDVRFLQNRFAMDSANLLFGAAFWTCLCSSGAFYAVFSVFTFLCMYSRTQSQMVTFCANVIGMLITVIAKQIVMLLIRNRWSRGYYRSRPAAVNVSNTIQEVWNLGLTTFTAVVRALKFLAISVLYLGRIDGEVFAPGVGWIFDSIPLDGLPHCFFRDVLVHDAHRHPLIERLGYLYMMKIRLGSAFGTQGGAAWRLLFTCSLMPWLRKYRQSLGIVGEGKPDKNQKSALKCMWDSKPSLAGSDNEKSDLKGMSKDALENSYAALEDKYRNLLKKMKSMDRKTNKDTPEQEGSERSNWSSFLPSGGSNAVAGSSTAEVGSSDEPPIQ